MRISVILSAALLVSLADGGCATTSDLVGRAAPFPLCQIDPWWGGGAVHRFKIARIEPGMAMAPADSELAEACAATGGATFKIIGDLSDAAVVVWKAATYPSKADGDGDLRDTITSVRVYPSVDGPCEKQSGRCLAARFEVSNGRAMRYYSEIEVVESADGWRVLSYKKDLWDLIN